MLKASGARISNRVDLDGVALLQNLILATLVVLLYYRILLNLVAQWWQDANYSYGFLVPVFAGWVIWNRRICLASTPENPSNWGLVVIAAALGEVVLGIVGAENFLSRTSLLLLVAGLIIYFRGWRSFRAVLFPWGVLFLMIPLPAIVFNQFALPLQFQASRFASTLLALVGVPVLREGNVIHLPSLTLDVVEACSGLRSLTALVTTAVIYGYLFEPRALWRLMLILAAIPIAVVANGFRIMGSGILGEYWSREMAQGFFHTFSGLLVFLFSLGLLRMFHVAASRIVRREDKRNP
jgi:exosortase